MWDKVHETVKYINDRSFHSEYGVILGSGLGGFTADMEISTHSLY